MGKESSRAAKRIEELEQQRNDAETAAGVLGSDNRRLRKRIEELEKDCKEWEEEANELSWDHRITDTQIDAAWHIVMSYREAGNSDVLEFLLAKLGIERCANPECEGGMYLAAKNKPQCGVSECPVCNGHGWTIRTDVTTPGGDNCARGE